MKSLRAAALAALCLLPFHTAPATAQGAADIMLRLDRMEAENRRLNGQVEQMSNQVRKLEDQLQRFQKDVDFRFKEAGSSSGGSAPAPKAQPSKKSDAFDPGASPSAPGAPRTIGQLAAEANGTQPTGITPEDKPQGATAPTAAAGTAKGDYEVAQNMLERGEYEAAEMAFREFTKKHGKDRLKVDAVFGLGETFYRRNRYREAAEQYLQITTDSPKSNRAPEALLKLGMSLRGLGATPEACGTYSEVNKKYPKASAAIKQVVDREKKRAQCA